jgi:hypothetical protein
MTTGATGSSHPARGLVLLTVIAVGLSSLWPAASPGQQVGQAAIVTAPHPPHRNLRGQLRDFEVSSVTPAGSIQAGQGGTANVIINRSGGHTAAVTLGVESNPQGITGTGSVAADSNVGTLNLIVPASAPAGLTLLQMSATDGVRSHTESFSLTVTVVPAVISTFTATPPVISPGQQSTLAFTFTGGTGSIDNGVGAVTSGGTSIVSPAATTTYTLSVTPPSGPAVQAQATVTVAAGNLTMTSPRAFHTETLLANGKVLLAGGLSAALSFTTTASADLYDPASGLLNPTTGPLGTGRWLATATRLNNGKVLVAGGFVSKYDGTTSAELYDPTTGLFTATAGPLHYPRGGHTATLLPSGEVLIVGGYSGKTNVVANYPSTCEIYNPLANSFRDSGSLNAVRGAHRATPIYNTSFPVAAQSVDHSAAIDNRVLISGGYSAGGFVTGLEWYYVASDTFATLSVGIINGRAFHTAALLTNNKVLLAGGGNSASFPISSTTSAELYDVATNTIAATGSLTSTRAAQASTPAGGKVLVSGGVTGWAGIFGGAIYTSVESYDPVTGVFTTLAAPMAAGRAFHTGTLLGNGKILLTGGLNISATGYILNTMELYTPPSP